jgi:hypothetical protein
LHRVPQWWAIPLPVHREDLRRDEDGGAYECIEGTVFGEAEICEFDTDVVGIVVSYENVRWLDVAVGNRRRLDVVKIRQSR